MLDNYRSNANIVNFANGCASGIKERFKNNDVVAISKNNGDISVVKLESDNITIPIVENILNNLPKGSTCIAVKKNIDALNIWYYLRKKNIDATIIQSAKDDLGRPTTTARENKETFMKFLAK